MPYTLDQLSTMIDSLTTRVNQIDGTRSGRSYPGIYSSTSCQVRRPEK
jgi:hypothetical protein